jgi:iron complex transport system substrate-binding protein
MSQNQHPNRIVCLTEETTETLYLLGEGDRVVGISGYTVRPPEARQKPKVSSFLHARYETIWSNAVIPSSRSTSAAWRKSCR